MWREGQGRIQDEVKERGAEPLFGGGIHARDFSKNKIKLFGLKTFQVKGALCIRPKGHSIIVIPPSGAFLQKYER